MGNYIFDFLTEDEKKFVENQISQKKEADKGGFQEFLKKKKNTSMQQ